MTTLLESAARHMAAGVEGLDELARLVEADAGRKPSRKVLTQYRSWFLRYGADWIAARREANRGAARRWHTENSERAREASRRWATENPEKKRESSRRWNAENQAKRLLNACRQSAKGRRLEFGLVLEEVEALLAPMTCAATGLPLTWEHDGDTRRNPWAPSIDRIDCSKGYLQDNVRVVCTLYNVARADWPDEAVTTLAEAIVSRRPAP